MPDSLSDTLPSYPGLRDTRENGPVRGLTELQWRVLILSGIILVTLISIYCLSHGITIVFMHLYYFPIVLLAYRYRYKGVGLATLLSLSYFSLVALYHPEPAELIGALVRGIVFIGIAAVVAYLSERLVTERYSEKKLGDDILHLQQFQEGVITNANIWISVLAPDGSILIWNDAAEAISGYKKDEVIGSRTVWTWLYPEREYRRKITADIQRIIERDTYLENFETEIRCADGTTKTIVWNTRGLRDTSGTVYSYIAIGRDITRRKMAEEQARLSTEIYHEFFTTSQDCVFITSPDGRWVDFNETAVDLFGYKNREELAKIPIRELYRTSADRDALLDQIRQHGFVKEYPARLRRREGKFIDTLITTTPLHNKDGSLRAYIGTIRDITERKKIEEALHGSEEKFRTIFNSINDGIHLHEIEPDGSPGRFIDVNDVACRMLQYSREDLLRMTPLDFAVPFHNPPMEEVLRDLRINGYAFFETGHTRKDGRVIPVEINAHVVSFSGTKLVVSVIRDITERKKIEEELRESHQLLQTVLDTIPLGVFWKDSKLRYLGCNRIAARDAGLSRPEDIIGKNDFDLAWRSLAGSYRSDDTRVMNSGIQKINYEENVIQPDGRVQWVRTNKIPLYDINGTIFGVVGTYEDITSRKEVEKNLAYSNTILRTQQETSIDGILVVDEKGKILSFNRRFVELLGIPEDLVTSLIDEPVLAFVTDQMSDPGQFLDRVRYLYDHREEKSIEEIQLKDKRVFERYSAPMLGENNRYFGRIWFFHDITERKGTEDELNRLNRNLDTLVQERTRALEEEIAQRKKAEDIVRASLEEKIVLLREVHHRVKNNLQILISLMNLQSRTASDPQVIAALQESTQRIRAMSMVHEKLYGGTDLSHIELRNYFSSLVNSQVVFNQLRPGKVTVEIVAQDILLDINTAIPLGLIINELISNAIKYAFPGDRRGAIWIDARTHGNLLDITVSDNGIGMPGGIDLKMSPSLGLRLVSGLVIQLKGTIELVQMEGTKFHLSIPLRDNTTFPVNQ
jgi:PAS domain S-box-containing protein